MQSSDQQARTSLRISLCLQGETFRGGNPSHLLAAKGLQAALSRIHALGVVHEDVKAENIVIESGTCRPVLIDFAFARHTADEQAVAFDASDLHCLLSRAARVRAHAHLCGPTPCESCKASAIPHGAAGTC